MDGDRFAAVQRIADAVLYEGYLLYPYRASSGKNRVRFQFGVVAPREHSIVDSSESWEQQTEQLIEGPAEGADPRLSIRVRFLQLQARAVEAVDLEAPDGYRPVEVLAVGADELVAWDEAVEGLVDIAGQALSGLLADGADGRAVPFRIEGGHDIEHAASADGSPGGRIVRTRWAIKGQIVLTATPVDGYVRLRIRVENLSTRENGDAVPANRDEALRRSLLGCHTLLAIDGGAFVSLTDPPPAAAAAAAGSRNLKTWPVLVGAEGATDLVLSSPIILSDYPAIAPESPQDLFDGAEIDEILTLRIMTLSDEEKRQARATDPRARAIIDAADDMPPEIMDRLHGAIRYLRGGPAPVLDAAASAPERAMDPYLPFDPYGGADQLAGTGRAPDPDFPTLMTPGDGEMPSSVWEPAAQVAPELMTVEVNGRSINKGSSVILRPNRRADSMDMFLVGRMATVEAVFESVDDEQFVAVTIDDDPATDLHRAYGRYFYFAPSELEPVDDASRIRAGSGDLGIGASG